MKYCPKYSVSWSNFVNDYKFDKKEISDTLLDLNKSYNCRSFTSNANIDKLSLLRMLD